jgi:hypothetical protein
LPCIIIIIRFVSLEGRRLIDRPLQNGYIYNQKYDKRHSGGCKRASRSRSGAAQQFPSSLSLVQFPSPAMHETS